MQMSVTVSLHFPLDPQMEDLNVQSFSDFFKPGLTWILLVTYCLEEKSIESVCDVVESGLN